MSDAAHVSRLDAHSLSECLRALAGEERSVQAEFLLHLDALDRCRGFAELGYPSLWEYCLRALHLREGAAGRRIGAMRVVRRFPRLEPALRDGRLCLSTLCQLGPILTEENVEDLSCRAAFRTKAEVEALVVAVRPRAAPVDGLRLVPVVLEVWARDGGRCTFTAPDGTRCGSSWKLELDHVQPAALGGTSSADNLRLRCRTHNVLHAEEDFGRAHMARFRAAPPLTRGGTAPSGRCRPRAAGSRARPPAPR